MIQVKYTRIFLTSLFMFTTGNIWDTPGIIERFWEKILTELFTFFQH